MRIGFDLRPAASKHSRRRGVGKYTWQLATALAKADHEHELVFFTLQGQEVPLGPAEVVELRSLARPARLNWLLDSWQLPAAMISRHLDLFEATEITSIPAAGAGPIWAHVHDLIPYLFWEDVGGKAPWDYRWALKTARKRFSQVELIITDSVHSQRDLCRELDLGEDRVEVVYAASHPRFEPQNGDQARQRIMQRYGISAPFLFYVGGSDFRKNLPRLVKAFGTFRESGFDGKLVLAGETFLRDIPETREIAKVVRHLELADHIIFPGYVPDEELPDFYSACRVFVFPSIYEGFGLPVLEAIQSGAVVAASNRSSIPEVGGEAVQYFDPESLENLVEALEIACFDRERRAHLREQALSQCDRFSWEKAAEQLLRLYQKLD